MGMMWMSPVNGCSFADAGARTGKMPARRARPAAGPSGPDGGAQKPIQPFMPAAWRVLSSWRPVMRLFLMACRRRAAEGPE